MATSHCRFRAVRQPGTSLIDDRRCALPQPRRAHAFAPAEPGEASAHQGNRQWVVCDLLLEVLEKLAAGCVLRIIDELINDLSGRHARPQLIEGVGKLLETVQLVRQRMNPRLKVGGIILTMFADL